MKGYMSPAQLRAHAAAMPRGIVRFIEGGEVAVWTDAGLHFMVTGHERAWGDRWELIRTFGPYVVMLSAEANHRSYEISRAIRAEGAEE